MNIVITLPDSVTEAAMKQVTKRAEGCSLSPQMKKRIIMKAVSKIVCDDPNLLRNALNNMSNQEFYNIQVLQDQ